MVNEIPIKSPSADQKSGKEASQSETVPELRMCSVDSERVVEGGQEAKCGAGEL